MTDNQDSDRMTLDQIATAAAALIADARAAGLAAPFTLTCRDYGPAGATLYLYAGRHASAGIRHQLQQWADHYGTSITTRPATTPGSVHATATFNHDGLAYEVSAIIRPDPDDEQHQDHDDDSNGDDRQRAA